MTISQIELWNECKECAIALTFDDLYVASWDLLTNYANTLNIPLTFYINTVKYKNGHPKLLTDEHEKLTKQDINFFRKIIKNGNEIGCHTSFHSNLRDMNDDDIEKDINYWIHFMKKNKIINNNDLLTFSYPYGYRPKSLKIIEKYFIGARSYGGGLNSYNPKNIYRLKTINIGKRTKIDKINDFIDEAINNKSFIIEAGHGLDEQGWSPIPSKVIFNNLDYIYSKKNIIWSDTMKNIILYINLRNNIKIIESYLYTQDLLIIEFKINNKLIENEFLTISLNLPKNKKIKNINQNNKNIQFHKSHSGKMYFKINNFIDHVYVSLCDALGKRN